MLDLAAAGDPDVAGYLRDWLAHAKGRVRPSTFRGYSGLIHHHAIPHLGELRLSEITPLHLQHLYSGLLEGTSDRHLSAGTVLNLHLVLTQALGQAVRWGLLDRNPASGAQPPRPRRAERPDVGPEQVAWILQAARGSLVECPVAMAIAIATGMRRGEILGLRWSDLSSDRSSVSVRRSVQRTGQGLVFLEPKTRRSRRAVELPAFLGPYLERQHQHQALRRERLGKTWQDLDLVVDAGDGRAVHPDTLSSGWRRLLRSAGLPHVRFHDLRHAHATLMLLQGVHPKVVSERLGHASIGITLDTYSHVLPSMQSEAVRAFDELFGPAVGAGQD